MKFLQTIALLWIDTYYAVNFLSLQTINFSYVSRPAFISLTGFVVVVTRKIEDDHNPRGDGMWRL